MNKENNRLPDQADVLRDNVSNDKTEALPSRSEIHAEKRKRTKWKIKFPLVRLLSILFILIPITILAVYFYNKEDNMLHSFFTPEVRGYDPITISKHASANQMDKETANNEEVETESEQKESVQKESEQKEEKLKKAETNSNSYGNEKPSSKDTSKTSTNNNASNEDNSKPEEEEPVISQERIEENVEYIEHIVQENETLFRISMKYYNSRAGEKIISDYNNLINNQVMLGQKLIIPLKKEQ